MQKITTCLWFAKDGQEAARFYASIFNDAKLLDSMPDPDGGVMAGSFELAGQEFCFINGATDTFNESISLSVSCKDQAEVDYYWDALLAGGGEESQCGWLKDKYGVSWQIAPDRLGELLGDPDPERAGRAMQAMLGMQKIDIAGLEKAAAGG